MAVDERVTYRSKRSVGDTTLLLIVINEKDISTGRCNPVPMEFFVDIRQREIFLPVVRVRANICVQISPDETLHVVRRGIIGYTNRSSLPSKLGNSNLKKIYKIVQENRRLLFFQLGKGIEEKILNIYILFLDESFSTEKCKEKR